MLSAFNLLGESCSQCGTPASAWRYIQQWRTADNHSTSVTLSRTEAQVWDGEKRIHRPQRRQKNAVYIITNHCILAILATATYLQDCTRLVCRRRRYIDNNINNNNDNNYNSILSRKKYMNEQWRHLYVCHTIVNNNITNIFHTTELMCVGNICDN